LVHLYLRIFNLSFEKNQNQEAEIFNLSFEKIKTKKQRSSIFPLKKIKIKKQAAQLPLHSLLKNICINHA